MAILGLFTTLGISKSIDAQNDEGFKIFPDEFGVSRNVGPLDPSRTGPNSGLWYQAAVTTRERVDDNTVKITCQIPQGATAVTENVKEIYLFAKDSLSNSFMLALGQPSENIIYDPDGTVKLELQLTLVDVDLTANYVFNNTQAIELEDHVTDPNAHPEYVEAMAKAGIFVPMGAEPFDYVGQSFEDNVEFDGTPATASAGGVNFSSVFNGTEGNSISLVFDGIDTVDTVVTAWNNANPDNLAEHDGAGTEVLTAQTVNLSSGTYVVQDKDLVYRDVDGVYKQALADGTIKAKPVALARRAERCVVHYGLFNKDVSGFSVGDVLYLSSTVAGGLDTLNNGVPVGIVLKSNLMLFTGFNGASDVDASQTFDAVVSNVTGLGLFATTQLAIDNVPTNSRILIDKLEDVKATISTSGKTLEFVFNGLDKGWRKFAGQTASFRIDFDSVPDNGTWRIEWNGQESADLAYNANAATIETEFNLFSGHTGATVTGDYSSGFVFTFLDEVPQPLPTFLDPGLNEIQRFNFSNVPDDGTVQFEFESQPTINFPWDDNAADLKIALENLSTINEVNVTGDFSSNFFQIEFIGSPYDKDGLQPQGEITVVAGNLNLLGSPTLINGTDPQVTVPISPITVQQGKYKANNLRVAAVDVVISVTENTVGEAIGPDTAIILDAPNIRMSGWGIVQDFENGIDVNGQDETVIALRFQNTTNPILQGDKLPGINLDTSETLGYAKDLFAQLKITEHPINKRRVKISAADVTLPSGSVLSQELNSLKLKLDGAEADFETGETFEDDGTTPLGLDFTPIIPAATLYRWASITVIPKIAVNGRLEGQLLVLFGENDDADQNVADTAPLGDGKPLGWVLLRGDLGKKEKTRFIFGRDEFSDYDQQYIILNDSPTTTVAFWADVDNNGSTEPAHGADRSVEVTGIVENDNPNAVAAAWHSAINGDAAFTATISNNRVEVEDNVIGSRPDATTSFSAKIAIDVLVQGIETDSSGLEPIENKDIYPLGVGSGGGGGAGDANEVFERIKARFSLGIFDWVTPIIFKDVQGDFNGAGTTGSYSFADNAFKFSAASEVFESIQLLDQDFLDGENHIEPSQDENIVDIGRVEVDVYWDKLKLDDAATYEISRDGGNEYQAITMERIGASDLFHGIHDFADEAANALVQNVGGAVTGVLDLTDSVELDRIFTLANPTTIKKVSFDLTVTGTPLGNLFVRIVKDNVGVPSTDVNDILFESSPINLSTAVTATIDVDLHITEEADDYHVLFITDQAYKDEYTNSVGANKISIDEDGTDVVYTLEGRELELLLKITSSAGDKLIKGLGVFYKPETAVSLDDQGPLVYRRDFDGLIDNEDTFTLPFRPNPKTLVVYDIDSGQSWVRGAFTTDGVNVTFPVDTFKTDASETVRLSFVQVAGGTIDNSDKNAALMASNNLGSTDPLIDLSVAGSGIKIRNSAGVLRELTLDASDNIVIKATS